MSHKLIHSNHGKTKKKSFTVGYVYTVSFFRVFARGNSSAGINEATQMVTYYFDPATQLSMAGINSYIFKALNG